MARKKEYRLRHDDQRPDTGFRLESPSGDKSVFLHSDEIRGAAEIAQLHQAMGESPEEIFQAIKEWQENRRRAKNFFGFLPKK